ncbi:sensor histidine kinase [Paenibacillus vini]|uniref:sensor histidine kinase n=1 Tax=Paenibacillus vini TaxID=1476024 RepID=UPI0025B6E937|nr:sensor histidine kinase [Paenibacillus vini]MDN4069044.1 sensor histidine kinase [Paenibacillus vini]
MSLIRMLADFLSLKKGMIFVYVLNTVLLLFLSYVFYDVNDIMYPLLVSCFILFIYLVISGTGYFKLCVKLQDCKSSPQMELDESKVLDKLLFGKINEIHEQYNARIYELKSSDKERNTLFSQWIHNMKGSVSIIGLASEQGSKQAMEDIQEENGKLMANLEECLNVLRLDDFSRDYLPERVNLHRVATRAINARKKDFIYQGVYPKVEIDEALHVYTDEKWCGYMLEQVLSNAVKYSRREGLVTVRSEVKGDRVLLTVQDNGIGICPEELPRVFDPFFTGRNGREDRSATGIGLYMVKYIAQRLGHGVSMESHKGAGSMFTISFLAKM